MIAFPEYAGRVAEDDRSHGKITRPTRNPAFALVAPGGDNLRQPRTNSNADIGKAIVVKQLVGLAGYFDAAGYLGRTLGLPDLVSLTANR